MSLESTSFYMVNCKNTSGFEFFYNRINVSFSIVTLISSQVLLYLYKLKCFSKCSSPVWSLCVCTQKKDFLFHHDLMFFCILWILSDTCKNKEVAGFCFYNIEGEKIFFSENFPDFLCICPTLNIIFNFFCFISYLLSPFLCNSFQWSSSLTATGPYLKPFPILSSSMFLPCLLSPVICLIMFDVLQIKLNEAYHAASI